MQNLNPVFVIFSILFFSMSAYSELASRGEIKIETRYFNDDAVEATQDSGFGLATRLEIKNTHEKFIEKIQIFSRIDDHDPSRNYFQLEEAFVGYLSGNFEIKAGNQILNWSAAEAFHPADIINSRNFDSHFENAEKMAEPILSIAKYFNSGNLTFFYMPYFKKPNLPNATNRISLLPSSTFQIDQEQILTKGNKVTQDFLVPQYAIKFDWSFDNADISIHAVDHIDRTQPVVSLLGSSSIGLTYLPVTQYGWTYQHTLDAFVLKSEIAYRDFYESSELSLSKEDHTQVALGVDYGWSNNDGSESIFLMEFQYIPDVKDETKRAQLNAFQNDLLIGYRHAFNDISGQEFLISIISDLERENEHMLNANYSKRLTDTWSMKTGIRIFEAPLKGSTAIGLESLNNADQFYFDISRRF